MSALKLGALSLVVCVLSFFGTLYLMRWDGSRGDGAGASRVAVEVVEVTGDLFNLSWEIDGNVARGLVGQTIEISARMLTTAPQKFGLQIVDGIGDGRSQLHSGNGKWEDLSASYIVQAGAARIRLRFVYARQLNANHAVLIKDLRAKAGTRDVGIDEVALLQAARDRTLGLHWTWDGGIGKLKAVTRAD